MLIDCLIEIIRNFGKCFGFFLQLLFYLWDIFLELLIKVLQVSVLLSKYTLILLFLFYFNYESFDISFYVINLLILFGYFLV